MLNIALTEHTVENYVLGHRYDEAGFWEYYSLRNLLWYLSGGCRRHAACRLCDG